MLLKFTIFAVLLGAVCALDCVQIPDSSIKPKHFAYIPAGAKEPVVIPPNYDCTYNIKVPPMVYAHIRLENYLKAGNDMITVYDAQRMKTIASSRNSGPIQLYVFPNTTSTIRVTTKSVDVQSKFRIVVYYNNVPTPLISNLINDSPDLRYFYLNDLQLNSYKQPVTVTAQQKLSVSIVESHRASDVFTGYYVIDGDLNENKGVYHLSSYINRPFLSSGNKVTVMGLDNLVSQSAIMFTPLSEALKFDSLDGTSTYWEANTITINANGGLKKAMTVISKDSNQTTILDMSYDSPSCSIKAVETPATPSSPLIVDFRQIQNFPYILPQIKFVIVVDNCSATFKMVSPPFGN